MTAELLTTKEAATELHVSTSTVLRMVADGRLQSTGKLPGRTGPYLFTAEEIRRVAALGSLTPCEEK